MREEDVRGEEQDGKMERDTWELREGERRGIGTRAGG